MNKWITLIATLLITLVFAVTIKTTIANPIRNNLIISGALLVVMFIGIFLFFKSSKPTKTKVGNEEFTPIQ